MRVLFLSNNNKQVEVTSYLSSIGHKVTTIDSLENDSFQSLDQLPIDLIIIDFESVRKNHLAFLNKISKMFGASCPVYYIKKQSSVINQSSNEFLLIRNDVLSESSI